MKATLVPITLAVVIIASAFFAWKYWQLTKVQQITNFDQCAAAGYPVMESFPEQCATPDGRSFTRDLPNTPVEYGEPITVTGEVECLPHKNVGPGDVITLECTYGIKDEDGRHYALSDPQFRFITNLPTGETATVNGTLLPALDSKYDIVGTIELNSVE